MTKFSTPLCSMNVMRSRFSNTGHCQLFFARVARFSRVFLGSRNYKFSIRLSLCSTIYCLHNKGVPCYTMFFFVACLVYKKSKSLYKNREGRHCTIDCEYLVVGIYLRFITKFLKIGVRGTSHLDFQYGAIHKRRRNILGGERGLEF